MKILKSIGHQGDVQMFSIDCLPKGLKKVEKQFLAESERSGSMHALFGDYDLYEYEDDTFIVDAHTDCILNHSLKSELENISFDTAKITKVKDHRHSVIPAGTKAIVGIQNRFDPMSAMKKRVID